MEEERIDTAGKIADYIGVHRATLYRSYLPDMRKSGIIFKRFRRARNGGKERIIFTFGSMIQRFLIMREEK
jgi:hypothetical protein